MSGSSTPGSWSFVVENEVPAAVVPTFSASVLAAGLTAPAVLGALIDGSLNGLGAASGRPRVAFRCERS